MDPMIYPQSSRELNHKREAPAPEIYAAFRSFSERVFADGALPSKTKELIAVAVGHDEQRHCERQRRLKLKRDPDSSSDT